MTHRRDRNKYKAEAGDREAANTFAALRGTLGAVLQFSWEEIPYRMTGRIRGPDGTVLDLARGKMRALETRGWVEQTGRTGNVYHYTITESES